MKYFKALILAALLAVGFTACNKPMTQDEVMNTCGSGVVLIVNEYYYKITLGGGEWYFTGFDEDGDLDGLVFDQDEVKKKTITGTGFFVSEDGKIMTNRHVAAPSIKLSDTKRSMRQFIEAVSERLGTVLVNMSEQYNKLENDKNNCYEIGYDGSVYYDSQRLSEIESEMNELKSNFQAVYELKNNIGEIDLSEAKVTSVCELSIAYNDTYVTKKSDLKGCVKIWQSDNEDVDLALLQLKDKKTPADKYVFDINARTDEDDDADLTDTERKLYMIGFNAGIQLANTQQGIKAQITNGQISQVTDNTKIMYTIPSLPGSSGSPVVDGYGNLVAVNFAGVTGTQSFNYGIRIKAVRREVNGL